MEIPAWLIIAGVGIAIAGSMSRLSLRDVQWFMRLRRPPWLTFERFIPLIWITILICGGWSAYLVWQTIPGTAQAWQLMAGYLLLEVVIMAYTPVMCRCRRLLIGVAIGGFGVVVGVGLTIVTWPISPWSGGLLLPYLLWSPIGTWVTWKMVALNPGQG
ncbi:TspO/MBR family protein [Spirulina major]|uniref:TspO/MBR family protein n=1 Tax=Spirulina major TaxID=270636 RepID=UPI000934D6E0|nr:tryptophan-rich sensory protein [Spirulina major]